MFVAAPLNVRRGSHLELSVDTTRLTPMNGVEKKQQKAAVPKMSEERTDAQTKCMRIHIVRSFVLFLITSLYSRSINQRRRSPDVGRGSEGSQANSASTNEDENGYCPYEHIRWCE